MAESFLVNTKWEQSVAREANELAYKTGLVALAERKHLIFFEAMLRRMLMDTIPNSVVKFSSADDTVSAMRWDNRSLLSP